MKYLLTGGGTGGHVYPALAIQELIADDDQQAKFLYVGVAGKAEEFILGELQDKQKIPLHCIHSSGLPRKLNIAKILQFIRDLWHGFWESRKIIKSFKPDIIIATGGYVTAPVIFAGYFARKKILLYEPNSVPGLANKFLSRFAHRVLVTFPETVSAFTTGKAEAVGYPLRRRLTQHKKEYARGQLGIPMNDRFVFIFGGSSGAQIINEAVVRNLKLILAHENIIVIHGTGRDLPGGVQLFSETKALLTELYPSSPPENRYIVRDYFIDINLIYSAADLVVSRAGAGTIMECAALGIPMILVPKSGLPGDHQVKNAQTVETGGGGIIVKEEIFNNQTVLDGEKLIRTIVETVNNSSLLVEMSKNIRKIYFDEPSRRILYEIKRALTLH